MLIGFIDLIKLVFSISPILQIKPRSLKTLFKWKFRIWHFDIYFPQFSGIKYLFLENRPVENRIVFACFIFWEYLEILDLFVGLLMKCFWLFWHFSSGLFYCWLFIENFSEIFDWIRESFKRFGRMITPSNDSQVTWELKKTSLHDPSNTVTSFSPTF